MFQNSFLIIKSDYLHRRKPLLTHLMRRGFLIQANRRLQFSPELAAEFYQDNADEPTFMMQVILLSKGVSEAFILTKENAAEDLINTMVCYFGTSTEMYRNIHVTRCLEKVKSEITYVFPNYIHEPIFYPDKINFCTRNQIVKPIFDELYDIIKNTEIYQHKSWKTKLIEFLKNSNRELPRVSNQCAQNLSAHVQEQGQQTTQTSFIPKSARKQTVKVGSASASLRSLDFSCNINSSSLNFSTSSCLSCSLFGSQDECLRQVYAKRPMVDLIKAKTAPLKIKSTASSSEQETKEKVDKAVGPQYSFLYDLLGYNDEESYEDNENDSTILLDAPGRKPEQIKAQVVTVDELGRESSLKKHEDHPDAVYLESTDEISEEIAKNKIPPYEGAVQYEKKIPKTEMVDDTLTEATGKKPPAAEQYVVNAVKSNLEKGESQKDEVTDQISEADEIKAESQTFVGEEKAVEENKVSTEGE